MRIRLPLVLVALLLATCAARAADLPNIVWITSEDNGPHLGCYGDKYADTPHLDGLAKKGLIYLNAWSTAPVCAPARTTIISGLYPPSTGSEHMRSMTRLPAAFRMYPQYMRAAGYYCTNRSKEDYNLAKEGKVWDDSSKSAHWTNRKEGQPFFAIFNHTVSHESQVRRRPHKPVHDPKKVRVPAYHPDTPEVRRDWAQYYDKLTEMDGRVGKNLAELEAAGLADETIIFYYGDHGAGMPRSKRWPYNSGLSVPLIVYVPPKWKHLAPPEYSSGGKTDRLVGFIDLAPTLLSLAGIKPPAHFQGHAFLGKYAASPQPYQYGFRGRMDERYDMVRVVRDKRYIYIRNYMPHKIYGQYIAYMFQTPTTRVWKEMYDAGKLNDAQSAFWKTKAAEELYDLRSDPDEIHNLANSEKHSDVLKRMRRAQRDQAIRIRDVGFLPENQIHERSAGSTPYEMGHDESKYPMADVLAAAERASSLRADDFAAAIADFSHQDSGVRYWAVMGALMRGKRAVSVASEKLKAALDDPAPSVRVIAAQALLQYGKKELADRSLKLLVKASDLRRNNVYVAMLALNALDAAGAKAKSQRDVIKALPSQSDDINRRMRFYIPDLIKKTTADLE